MALVSVRALDLRRIRVNFDSGVASGILDGDLFSFTTSAVPSYKPVVESVRYVNGRGIITNSLIELNLDNDLSPGLEYSLVFVGYGGNAASTTLFTAYAPQWPPNRAFELWDWMPRINKEEDTTEHLERFISALQDQLDGALSSVDNWTDIFDYDRATERWLDVLLKDFGNPFVFEDLTENDKRRLLRVLVAMFKLKGTADAIKAAVRFFLGMEAQINLYRQSGSLLSSPAVPLDRIDETFVLGTGTNLDFAVSVAPTDPPGRDLTTLEESRIRKIVAEMKAVFERQMGPVFSGLVSSDRLQITGSSSSKTVSWKQTATVPTNWRVYYRTENPGVSPFNSARYSQVAGGTTSLTLSLPVGLDSPGSIYYFVLVPYYDGAEGFRSEREVTSALEAPASVITTSGPRSVIVTWTAVTGATSYLVYKRLQAPGVTDVTPITAEQIFEVLGGTLYVVDTNVLPGQVVYYSVVPRVGDSEGEFSPSVSGTAA